MTSWALRARALPRALSYLGVAVGIASLLTVASRLQALGFGFGLGLVVWFVGLGIATMRPRHGTASLME